MSHEAGPDLRIRRTHKFLKDAMIQLIAEKGFDAITVGDIAERAMINRATSIVIIRINMIWWPRYLRRRLIIWQRR